MITIETWCQKINSWATVKGWNQNEVGFGEFIALCHSELSEALEEYRNGHSVTEVYYTESNEADTVSVKKPEGIPIELADVLIRIFHFAGRHNIDLEQALDIKHLYNTLRPQRHGGKVI